MRFTDIGPTGRTLATLLLVAGLLFGSPAAVQAQVNTPLEKLKTMAADSSTPPDLARAALLGAQLVRPAVDPDAYLAQLDQLAAEARVQLQSVTAAVDATNILSNYLYNGLGYANSAVLSADVFVGLDQVLEGRQWNCVGMSLLYVALGDRLGIPLQMVAGYGHVFVAYTGTATFYLETTASGRLEATRDYLREYLPFPCTDPTSYVALNPRESVALCLTQMGLAMQRDGRIELARTLFNLALEFSPNYAEAHGGLAFLLIAEGKGTEAITTFERAISLNPDFREGYGGLGNALAAQGNTLRAIEAYRTLVALCPEEPTAIFNLGQLLYDTGNLEDAIAAFDRYIELEPQDPEGYMRIAFPLEDIGNMERAAEAYNRVLQLAPGNVNALSNLGNILENVGDLESAMGAYERALTVNPQYLQAMAGVSRVLGKAGRFDDALRTFRDTLRIYPGEAFVWVDLGRLFERAGDYRQAIGAYQEATRVAPLETEGYYALAETFLGLGMNQEARQIQEQVRLVEEERARRQAIPLPGTEGPDAAAPVSPFEAAMPAEAMPDEEPAPTDETPTAPEDAASPEAPMTEDAPETTTPAPAPEGESADTTTEEAPATEEKPAVTPPKAPALPALPSTRVTTPVNIPIPPAPEKPAS